MLDRRKIITLGCASVIFALGVLFLIAERASCVAAFLSLFTKAASGGAAGHLPLLICFVFVIAVCDVCAALIYLHHAIVKRRPV